MSMLKKIRDHFNKPGFISEIDRFINEFNKKSPKKSRSQQQEINKFKRIFYLRDHVVKENENKIWQEF